MMKDLENSEGKDRERLHAPLRFTLAAAAGATRTQAAIPPTQQAVIENAPLGGGKPSRKAGKGEPNSARSAAKLATPAPSGSP